MADAAARLIALDWGTSSLRAYRLGAGGAVLESRQRPWGILHLPEPAPAGFEAALRGIAGDWIDAAPGAPLLACGMVGSAQGWAKVPYVDTPADAVDLSARLQRIQRPDAAPLQVVPGVRCPGERPDVMRGEETQVVGALASMPALAAGSQLLLPGTHSKWVEACDGRITGFRTCMTGELYAVLKEHSILGRPAREAATAAADDEGAFDGGVQAARGREPLATQLFAVRTLVLEGRLAAAHSLDYLSGLLIGDELRAMSGAIQRDAPLALVGEPALCARYRCALAAFGRADVPVVDGAAPAGLWALARSAGLGR
jgi:2-dehydro-3-deoxygalactonokinase